MPDPLPKPLADGNGLTVRPARPADLDLLCQLEADSFDPQDAFSRRQYRRLLANRRAHITVAQVDHRLVGSAVLLRRRTNGGQTARLYSLAVSPACRGRGLGRTLLDRVIRACRREAIGRLSLEVRADNEPAIRLYQSRGFDVSDHLPDYYSPGGDGLRMTLSL